MTMSPAAGTSDAADSQLDQDIFEAMVELIGYLKSHGEQIAQHLALNASDCVALRQIGGSVAMKELGRRLHCDPSFVTSIADALEKRGLARREVDLLDRRVKNLVLTPDGVEMKSQLEREFRARMPWTHALDTTEREHFLVLIRKMIKATKPAPTPPIGGQRAGEVSDTLTTTTAVGH
jgi:DNA-binding MarR family transcriptional regulator